MLIFQWIIIHWQFENILYIVSAGEGVVKMVE
jgi:hypothetical protein